MKTIALSASPGHLDAFAALPAKVRRDPYRTGLLPSEVWKGFVMMPTPFPKEFWIIEDSRGEVVGRIGASVSPTRKGEGAIGFFEVDLASGDSAKIADALLSQAESWLKSKGVSSAHGPMNFNTWFPYRFRVSEPKERFTWEPENPPEYVEFWQKRGYTNLESYHSAGYGAFDRFLRAESVLDKPRAE